MKTTHTLVQRLRPLTVLDATSLAQIAGGGQSASTSTSGTPAAGDDTVGDASSSGLSAGKVSYSDLSVML